MLREDDNVLENFEPHEDEKFILEEQDIEGDHRDLIGKSLDTKSHLRVGLSELAPQDGFFASESSSSLKMIRLSEQEFFTCKPVLDVKYYHSGFQNINLFYLFNK